MKSSEKKKIVKHGETEADKKLKFLRLCCDICSSYEKLQKEFLEIKDILSVAETCALAYSDMSFIKMHLDDKQDLKLEVIGKIISEVEEIKEGSKEELLCNINFVNIKDEMAGKENKGELIDFVTKAKKTLEYVIYQIDRIYTVDNGEKQVAILKGMIAYY